MIASRPTTLALALAVAVGLVGLGALASRQAWSADESPTDLAQEIGSSASGSDDNPAATVNGTTITFGRVRAYQSLAAQNQRLTGVSALSAAAILDGLVAEELLYQEAVRRGLQVSEKDSEDAVAQARAATDSEQMEFVLAFANQSRGLKLDADSYWALPDVVAGHRRSLTVQRLVQQITEGSATSREESVASETLRLRERASVTIAPEFR